MYVCLELLALAGAFLMGSVSARAHLVDHSSEGVVAYIGLVGSGFKVLSMSGEVYRDSQRNTSNCQGGRERRLELGAIRNAGEVGTGLLLLEFSCPDSTRKQYKFYVTHVPPRSKVTEEILQDSRRTVAWFDSELKRLIPDTHVAVYADTTD